MPLLRSASGIVLAVLTGSSSLVSGQTTSTGSAQAFPTKPIRFIVPGTGGDTDLAARLVAPLMSSSMGQPIIIENRPSGVIPAQMVSKAPADGYTMLITGASHWISPLLEAPPYDVVKDFLPVTSVTKSINILFLHPSVPAKSVKELIAVAKSRPGQLNYGSGATGASTHLAAEMFKYMAGLNIVRVRYASGGMRITGLLSGEVQMEFESTAAMQHVKSGKLIALAVTSSEPSALAPGLPTMAASGLPGYKWEGLMGTFVPAKTPASAINRLNQEIGRALTQQDVKAKLVDAGAEAFPSTPAELAEAMKSQTARLEKMIKEANIRND